LIIGFKHYIEPELSDISLIGDTVLVLIAYFASSQYFKPIDIYQIRTKSNALITQLYASKAKRFKCADFMKAFSVQMAERNEPNQALLPTTTAVTPAASHPSRQP
jgi:hypothetical protein